jgi:diacylglycerol kinase (ATP)
LPTETSLRILANPSGGRGRVASRLDSLRAHAHRLGVELELSDGPQDLTDRARRAVDAGVDRLLVAGGDGTLHYVIQALAQSGTVLGLLPLGRADDFAAQLGLPRDLDAAMEVAVDGEVRCVDLGRAGTRWFAGIASVGLDGEACRIANEDSGRLRGPLVYAMAAIRAWRSYVPIHARVTGPFGSIGKEVLIAGFANSPRYGGGLRLAPAASIDDGLLDVVIVKRMSAVAVVAALPSLLLGRHLGHRAVRFERGVLVSLDCQPGTPLYADGELIGLTGPASTKMECIPGALKVAVARDARDR